MTALALTGCGQKSGTVADSDEIKAVSLPEEESAEQPGTEEDTELPLADGGNEEQEGDTEVSQSEEEKEAETMPATLLYQGHGSVRIVTAEGKVIYVDPFMGEGYNLPADMILMTHGHYDHTQDQLISKRNEDLCFIKWSDALKDGVYSEYDQGYVKVEAVEAGYNANHNAAECVGYILSFTDGVTLYLSGDTSATPAMADMAQRELDYAFLCCDGVYNMDVAEASDCAKLINAKHTIPYHMEAVKDKSGFDMSVAESFDAPGKIILKPGEELVLE